MSFPDRRDDGPIDTPPKSSWLAWLGLTTVVLLALAFPLYMPWMIAVAESYGWSWVVPVLGMIGALVALTLCIVFQVTLRSTLVAIALVAAGGSAAWFLDALPGRAFGPVDGGKAALHYTVNHSKNFPDAAKIGFNLADVSSVASLDALPDGALGLLWMRNGYNTTCEFKKSDDDLVKIVQEARDHPKFSGIYFIADIPRPTTCPDAPERIAERTALIHKHHPEGRSFIAISGGYYYQEEFAQLADSADLIGVVVYPCNTKLGGCDMDKIDERVNRALDAGIPKSRLVPVFQAFGQACTVDQKNFYSVPSSEDVQKMFDRWDSLLPPEIRPFDMTYSWGMQETQSCPSLAMMDGGEYPDLQQFFKSYFQRMNR
ncbi:hypothetical protein CLV78_102377 [Aliiruegeria haliotis]|uniref:Uncharacterized protein n=2 Tax=Aliiruegeria haliotis TaxID=1280846 RepID=A0A2T0RVM2_9RHOB|nr:hypothetical protein CLV78_102377 [Aliiruegeria haliotis]